MKLLKQIFTQEACFFLVDHKIGDTEGLLTVEEKDDVVMVVLDGAQAKDKDGLMAEAFKHLDFPEHFGHNWDALYDSLTDLLWSQTKGKFLLIFNKAEKLLSEGSEEDMSTMLEIFNEAVNSAADERNNVIFKVVFLLEDATKSKLGTVIVNKDLKGKVIKADH